jgi:aspartyl-tRNA(Asn)/glutamyl-tRNA(Gln) amidotransferase subunit A
MLARRVARCTPRAEAENTKNAINRFAQDSDLLMTTANDIAFASIEDAAAEIAAKRLSPLELTDALLDRIERLNPQLNAYMTVTADAARAAARGATDEIAAGTYRGALHGIPIAHKDLFETKGVRTTAGSKVLDANIPDADAAVVEKLAAAGAISLGKLGLHEWALGTSSANEHYGCIRNPWNTDCIPGGSSGGTGSAVAAGLAFAGTGSDTGGSIRIPASDCGIVGLMPTYGRVSLRGAVPLSWTLDHAGPLTRTVRDAAIVLQAVAGHDPRDPASVDAPVASYLDGIDRGPKGLRIGVPSTHFWDKLDPRVETLVRRAIDDLASAGAEVREIPFERAAYYSSIMGPIIIAEAAAVHTRWYPEHKSGYGAAVASMIEAASTITSPAYAAAMRGLQTARAGEADEALEGVDVLACPTLPEPPPTIENVLSGAHDVRRTMCTSLFDVTGQPVLTVPCGLTPEGLPTGISFVARRWDETTALRAGRAYEMVRGPFPAPPIS